MFVWYGLFFMPVAKMHWNEMLPVCCSTWTRRQRGWNTVSKINAEHLEESKNRVQNLCTTLHKNRINNLGFISILSQIMLSDMEPIGAFILACRILCFMLTLHISTVCLSHTVLNPIYFHICSILRVQKAKAIWKWLAAVSCQYWTLKVAIKYIICVNRNCNLGSPLFL